MQPTIQAAVDRLLLEQGFYAPVDLLMSEGRLRYADYEAWRCGKTDTLAELLLGNPERIQEALVQAADYAAVLRLQPESCEYQGWGVHAGGRPLRFSRDERQETLFRTHFLSRRDTPQMDLFMDNSSAVVVNGIVDALVARDGVKADRLLARLCDRDAGHPQLGALERLREMQERLAVPGFDAAAELQQMQASIVPMAREVLRGRSRDYLVPLWRCLAKALDGFMFDPASPDRHKSYAAGQSLDWRGVREAVEQDATWRKHAVLHIRRAIACDHLGDQEVALKAWFDICWCFPVQAEAVLNTTEFSNTQLQEAWDTFNDLEPALDVADFPTWCLMVQCDSVGQISLNSVPADTRAGNAFSIVQQLLLAADIRHRTPDRGALRLRAELKRVHEGLFRHFMRIHASKV